VQGDDVVVHQTADRRSIAGLCSREGVAVAIEGRPPGFKRFSREILCYSVFKNPPRLGKFFFQRAWRRENF